MSTRTNLITEWDRIREYEETATERLASARAALAHAREKDVAEIAAAVRAESADPDTGTNEVQAQDDVKRLELVCEGVVHALTHVEHEISLAVQKELAFEVPPEHMHAQPTVPHARPAGEVLWSRYEEAVEQAIARKRAGETRREQLTAYDRALQKRGQQQFEHERRGGDPRSFQPELTPEEEAALNPPGSAGAPRLYGQEVGDVLVGERGGR